MDLQRYIDAVKDAETELANAMFGAYPVGSDIRWKTDRWVKYGRVERHVNRMGDPRLLVRNRETGKTRMIQPHVIYT